MYGWYSLNAYKNGEKEYIYMNDYNQITLCTIISYNKICPYTNKYKNDVVFCGKIKFDY
jgi:hypothetical protein